MPIPIIAGVVALATAGIGYFAGTKDEPDTPASVPSLEFPNGTVGLDLTRIAGYSILGLLTYYVVKKLLK